MVKKEETYAGYCRRTGTMPAWGTFTPEDTAERVIFNGVTDLILQNRFKEAGIESRSIEAICREFGQMKRIYLYRACAEAMIGKKFSFAHGEYVFSKDHAEKYYLKKTNNKESSFVKNAFEFTDYWLWRLKSAYGI